MGITGPAAVSFNPRLSARRFSPRRETGETRGPLAGPNVGAVRKDALRLAGAGEFSVKALRQLLHESWLPLVLGLAWTVYNLADRPINEWSLKDGVNVFGPTFFFVSWMVAQWYRVRKQQRVEGDLAKLQAGIQALQTPLLPCALFLTTKIEATDDDLKRVFENQNGFRAYGPGIPLPPPPFGPPPGFREGRLQRTFGYIEFLDGSVLAAGVGRPDLPEYNEFHAKLTHSFCQFDPRSKKTTVWENDPVFQRPGVKIEIYDRGRPQSDKVEPALVLHGKIGSGSEAIGAHAIDNTVLVDFAPRTLAVTPPGASGWSPRSLERSFIRFTFDWFFVKGLADLPEASWPSIHNLQLILGESHQVLSFPLEVFKDRCPTEPARPLTRGDAVCPRLVVEFELTPEAFASAVASVP